MTREDDELRQLWLAIEAIVGDSEIELADLDDSAPSLSRHEPTEVQLDRWAAEVAPAELAAQRHTVDALIREEWQRARERKPARQPSKRPSLAADLSRGELLAMVQQLQAAHPQQFAQHYRNLDSMTDATLRALVEDMLALVNDGAGDHET